MHVILAVVFALPILQHLHLIGHAQLRTALVKWLFYFELFWSTDVEGVMYINEFQFHALERFTKTGR